MADKPVKVLFDLLTALRKKEIDKQCSGDPGEWLAELGQRIGEIDRLFSDPEVKKYFLPSEFRLIRKRIFRAKRLYMIVKHGRSPSSFLSNNAKRKLCRIRSLRQFFMI